MAAVSLMNHMESGRGIVERIVHKVVKAHGSSRLVEGTLTPGAAVAVGDATCSTGSSIFHAIAALEAEGFQVVSVLAIQDRHRGGGDKLRSLGYRFDALLEADPQGNIRAAGR